MYVSFCDFLMDGSALEASIGCVMENRSILHYRVSNDDTKVNYCVDRVSHQTINNECILHCQVGTPRDPFVSESNQSGHPSSVSGDRIARCKRWIEREILKPSRLLIAFSMMFWLPRKKVEFLSTYNQIVSFSFNAQFCTSIW